MSRSLNKRIIVYALIGLAERLHVSRLLILISITCKINSKDVLSKIRKYDLAYLISLSWDRSIDDNLSEVFFVIFSASNLTFR